MAVVFPDDFLPEFAAVDPDVAAFWISQAECAIDGPKWLCAGVNPDCGVVAKASHLMALVAGLLPAPAVPINAITSESRGGKSISRAVGGGATGAHGSTVYGQSLDNMLARVNSSRRKHLPPAPQPSC